MGLANLGCVCHFVTHCPYSGDSPAQADPQLEANQSSILASEPADWHSDQTTDGSAASHLPPAGQPEEDQQAIRGKLPDAVQRPAPAVTNAAESAAPSSGKEYSSVPPSNLWGPPEQSPAASSSSANAVEGQAAPQAGSGLTQVTDPDLALAAPDSAVADPDSAVADPDSAVTQNSSMLGSADNDAVGGEGLESPRVAQTGYGWGSNRPATHVNFARGRQSRALQSMD